jgi:hypothetical protein
MTQRLPGGYVFAEPPSEVLRWFPASTLPDADTTVLLWVQDGRESDWSAGWWDGEDWRDCASGGVVAGEVTHWAEPAGPPC